MEFPLNEITLVIVLFCALCRLGEIALGEVNARRMLAEGGKEFAPYQRIPVFLGYGLWLASLVLVTPKESYPHDAMLVVFLLLQAMRWWAIIHLGKYWTTRIVVIPLTFRITTGPYRFLKHPIYFVLLCEVMALSLTFGQLAIGCIATGLIALWIRWRVREENRVMKAMMLDI